MNPLLITVVCGATQLIGPLKLPRSYTSEGLFVCAEPTRSREVTLLTPPVRGKYIAQNINQIFEVYDFDGTPEQKGMLWWRESVQKNGKVTVGLPVGEKPYLPNVVSLASAQTGKQIADIYYLPVTPNPIGADELSYSCQGNTTKLGDSKFSAGTGVGACTFPVKANITLTVAPKSVPAVVRFIGCETDSVEQVTSNSPVSKEFPARDCEMRVRIVDETGERNSTLVFRTYSREDLLPKPVWNGKDWRWPFDATTATTIDNCGYAWSKEASSFRCK